MVILNRTRIMGPLAPHIQNIEKQLLASGYTRFSTNNRLIWTAQMSRWMHDRQLSPQSLKEADLQRFVRSRRRFASTFSRGYLESIVSAMISVGAISKPEPLPTPAPSPIDLALEPFCAYLKHERAISESTQKSYTATVRRFLFKRFGSSVPRQQDITADDLIQFIVGESRHYKTSTTKYAVTALRSYVRFLYITEVISQDMTGAIPAIAGWRLSGLPKEVDPKIVSRILKASNRRTRTGCRDYAILLLLTRLGLRRGEVASLTLDDLDWARSELRIRGKGAKYELLPLSKEIGAALAKYLKKRGPCDDLRSVFLTVNAPLRPIASNGIQGAFSRLARKAGVPVIGAHRLRHSVATQILRHGGSLDEIAQVLRHSSHDTTAIYAKVDFSALQTVVHPWPRRTS